MAFDAAPGGDPRGPWCKACRRPIIDGEPAEAVRFDSAENSEMTGLYHHSCARPFASMARMLNMKPWGA